MKTFHRDVAILKSPLIFRNLHDFSTKSLAIRPAESDDASSWINGGSLHCEWFSIFFIRIRTAIRIVPV